MAKITEHPYKLINRLVQSGDYPPVLLLYGQERFMIDWAYKKIKSSIINPVTETLDYTVFDEKASVSEIIAACETVPFMSQKKLVLVKYAETDEDLTDYISSLPQSTLLILLQEKADKRKALYKKIEKIGLAYDFAPLDEATLASWAVKRSRKLSKQVILQYAKDAGYFDSERPYDLYAFENDLKKALALYEDKEQITYDDLEEISSASEENNAFKLLDAAFSNRKGDALRLLHAAVDSEQPSRQMSAVLRFHALLCSQLEIMLIARQRKEAGKGLSEMGVNPYRLEKAIKASERLSTARLKAALSGCYRIESDIKSGKIDARLAMELFIAKI